MSTDNRIKLWPVVDSGGIVPYLWHDGGEREATYMAFCQGTEVCFMHETGYGFLRGEDVRLMGAQ